MSVPIFSCVIAACLQLMMKYHSAILTYLLYLVYGRCSVCALKELTLLAQNMAWGGGGHKMHVILSWWGLKSVEEQAQWLIYIIPATQEAEIRRITV
jgi:hypothetical protein